MADVAEDHEYMEDLIKEKYPSIEIFFLCEEPGMSIYEKYSDVYFDEE